MEGIRWCHVPAAYSLVKPNVAAVTKSKTWISINMLTICRWLWPMCPCSISPTPSPFAKDCRWAQSSQSFANHSAEREMDADAESKQSFLFQGGTSETNQWNKFCGCRTYSFSWHPSGKWRGSFLLKRTLRSQKPGINGICCTVRPAHCWHSSWGL